MLLRTARTAFLIAGIAILFSSFADVRQAAQANLTGQGSLMIEQNLSTLHGSAAEQTRRDASGTIALGTLFILLGLGLHASLVRKQAAGRPVKVHRASEKSRTGIARRYWILRMNVRV